MRLGGVRFRPRLGVRASLPNSAQEPRVKVEWFKPRGYRHFDAQVSRSFAERVSEPQVVERHSWLPLIYYEKRTKRYKRKEGRTVFKTRPIMYASHRDSCILSKYAWDLSRELDAYYKRSGLDRYVIAYRRLGKSNYHFCADALQFVRARPHSVMTSAAFLII